MKLEGVPEGWELVRIGRPKLGEWLITFDGTPGQVVCESETANYVIIRKIEPVLDLSKVRLKKGWIAQDMDGQNYLYGEKPQLRESNWGTDCGLLYCLDALIIPWRADVPWTERIMEIPE